MLATLAAMQAQTPNQATKEEPLVLPTFQVSEAPGNQYGAEEANSTTRVSIPLLKVAQSLSVVTGEMMKDTQGFRILDTARYVTPILESSLPYGVDRYTLRGFQVSQNFQDGVNIAPSAIGGETDMANIERLEIVRGPNGILVPGGSPGGIVNVITKSPKFRNFGEISYQYQQYLKNGAIVDINRVFGETKNVALRLVASGANQQDGYFRGQFHKSYLIAPSLAMRLANDDLLIVKLLHSFHDENGGNGPIIDPSIGTSATSKGISYMPLDWSVARRGDTYSKVWETRLTAELNHNFGDVAGRLLFMYNNNSYHSAGLNANTPVAGNQGGVDPRTGYYVPFHTFIVDPATKAVTDTQIPPSTSQVLNRQAALTIAKYHQLHLKNDYAYAKEFGPGSKSTTIAGMSANFSRLSYINGSATGPQIDFANFAATDVSVQADSLNYTIARNKSVTQPDFQIFASERLEVLNRRLILSGGVSKYWGMLTRADDGNLPAQTSARPRTIKGQVTDLNYGATYMITDAIALFAGYNRVGGALPTDSTAGENPANFLVQQGEQTEAGVKTSFLKGRLAFEAAVFDIKQTNFSTINTAWAFDPSQPQFLFYDLRSKGVEFCFNMLLTPELAIVGNYQHNRLRTTLGVKVRAAPDDAGALMAKYTFKDGTFKGLGVLFAADYKGSSPGDQGGTGVTSLSTLANPIPNQPTFYNGGRTVFKFGLNYEYKGHYSMRLTVDNLTDRKYIQASLGRNVLIPGLPRSVTAQFSYKF